MKYEKQEVNMISIGEERYWKQDTNNEHFVVASFEDGVYRIEYLTNGRIHEKTKKELEDNTVLSDHDSFEYMDCDEIARFETGRRWLYDNRCRICEWRLKSCSFL